MLLSVAFFCVTCVVLWHVTHAWRNKSDGWCVIFIICTFLSASILLDHTFYNDEFFNMFVEWTQWL